MIYLEIPAGFNPRFTVASCFLERVVVESNREFLLLLRQDHKPQGDTWGVPAGKIESGETPLQAIQREVREESGFHSISAPKYHSQLFVRYPECDFIYHIFSMLASRGFAVEINPREHKEFRWVSPVEALVLPLIPDMDACIKLFYSLT